MPLIPIHSTSTVKVLPGTKTKEMLVGTVLKDPLPYVTLSDTPVERVMSFKLLGVYVASDLKWEQHIDTITSKAASRLYFLKQLKLVYLDIFSLHLSLMHRV